MHTNRLIHESSPYLLQHAHNPVDWFAWNDEALTRAREENKPILVSIGYAACHWCHVMEKESFENEATAAIMNENFINIKIDREERPDLDHIYMDAVQAMTGSGGWPLNVFLTPEAKPFYGGTYFPPRRAFNRPSWEEVLLGVVQAFKEKRHEIDAQAENLTTHLLQSNAFGMQDVLPANEVFLPAKTDEIFEQIMRVADREWGGFGKAPKFPQSFTIQFLLAYHFTIKRTPAFTKENNTPSSGAGKGEAALQQALLSLDKMIQGGIYDQAGGGFSRYATDNEWLVPHFEKMLYDNALLLLNCCDAYQLTKEERYKKTIDETMAFIQRELMDEQKGFYASLDADSENEEGKFYTWSKREVSDLLGKDADIFCSFYDITDPGNWEGKNILRILTPSVIFAQEKSIPPHALDALLETGKQKLLAQRGRRIRPLTDDKIILGWNALMNRACSRAFATTGNEEYRQLAIANMEFLLAHFDAGNGGFYHTWKMGKGKHPAFLDDYAFLIQALMDLQEITANRNWLNRARDLTNFVMDHFSETGTDFFYYTGREQLDVIVRKKESYDGAVASGNSVMAFNLYRLSILFDKNEWREKSFNMIATLEKAITRYPTSFGNWACLLLEVISGTNEIVITGENLTSVLVSVLKEYIPHRVLMASVMPDKGFPLLADKPVTSMASIWLCRDYACHAPFTHVDQLTRLINSPERH